MKQVHFFDIDTIMATIEADNDGLLVKAIAASGNERQKRSLTAQHDFMQIAMLIVRKVLQSWNNELTEKEIGQALGHALGNGIGFFIGNCDDRSAIVAMFEALSRASNTSASGDLPDGTVGSSMEFSPIVGGRA
ncbi:hypothetical protein [Brucella anthropi]|uniref:hypothetical protein n=1 Tax=Brucella anthropi TaxID=529 RepID=UPI003D973B0B